MSCKCVVMSIILMFCWEFYINIKFCKKNNSMMTFFDDFDIFLSISKVKLKIKWWLINLSILDLKVQTFYFCVNSWAFQAANSLSASRAAWSGKVTANRTVLSWRILWPSNNDVDKVRLWLHLQALFLDYFSQV